MEALRHVWEQGDGINRSVAALLLLMSVSAWVLILWKTWLLRRVQRDLARAVPGFWAASDLATARSQLAAVDGQGVVVPLVDAAFTQTTRHTLEGQGHLASQLTRRLRDALHAVLTRLQFGQVLLASIGATAPFVGLFGTVWSIYRALAGMGGGGAITIEQIAGPVGEALVMTAAGLAVAIPAVLAYNVFGKLVGACEADLEGFAHDLREWRLDELQADRARATPDA